MLKLQYEILWNVQQFATEMYFINSTDKIRQHQLKKK